MGLWGTQGGGCQTQGGGQEGTNSKVVIVGVWDRGGIQVDREAREVQGTRSESLARIEKVVHFLESSERWESHDLLSPGWATAKEGCG